MIKKHLLFRFIFLLLCLIPFGMLMFLGKPDRLQGILFDIENFIGLKTFALYLFIFGATLLGLEALWLLIKKKKSKFLSNVLLLLFFVPLAIYFSSQNVFYKKEKATATKVDHATLLVATEGSVYNFDLDEKRLSWKYDSPLDTLGNRNFFAIDGQHLFIPFESGSLKNFDINTGQIIWKQQIDGSKSSGMEINTGEDEIIEVENLRPLFMSKPLIDNKNIVIASHGQPTTTIPFLYSFDKNTGQIIWQEPLPTHFNIFAPIKYKGARFNYYFVNSAVYLEKYGANTGSRTSYGMYLSEKQNKKNRFKRPIYNQMQTDGRNLFIGDENGSFYCLPLTEEANVRTQDIEGPNNTFRNNPSVFTWIYNDETFENAGNQITFLGDKVLFADVRDDVADQSALLAINTTDGLLKWKKALLGRILNWTLLDNKIVGYTDDSIFQIDVSGQNFVEFEIKNKPLSNIEQIDSSHIIYITQQGIEVLDLNTKKANLVIQKTFNENHYNNVQIKYIVNK